MARPRLVRRIEKFLVRVRNGLIRRGAPPSWFGYGWVYRESVQAYLERKGLLREPTYYETIHPEAVAQNPLPLNVGSREELPDDRGWWGFSFRDVPARTSGETFIATLPDCLVVPYVDDVPRFWVGILNSDRRMVELRETHFREGHTSVLRSSATSVKLSHATWITERVYHNYSHWLTAHLPKLLLLKEQNALEDVLLPRQRPNFIDESIRLVGLSPDAFPTFNPERPIEVGELTVVETDRFRPELLRSVRDALPDLARRSPDRRIYISRENAPRRRLLNEDTIWPALEEAGFERVLMEELPFREQVRLMQETSILVAPHGAGLTNMMFCPVGTHVVEIADLSFPNPNFYALASAMRHHYWIVPANGFGDVHPLAKDLSVDLDAIHHVLQQLPLAGDSSQASNQAEVSRSV